MFNTANYTKERERGVADTTTVVTYTIMLWYTPQFYALFASDSDMDVFIDLIFEETNQGYINSEIPVRVARHEVRLHPTLSDMADSSDMLSAFYDSLPDHELLNCADSAALLIEDFSRSAQLFQPGFDIIDAFLVKLRDCPARRDLQLPDLVRHQEELRHRLLQVPHIAESLVTGAQFRPRDRPQLRGCAQPRAVQQHQRLGLRIPHQGN